VAFVRRAHQCNEHVHIKKSNAHSCSASSSATLVDSRRMIRKSKIVIPFTTRVWTWNGQPSADQVRHGFAQRHRSARRVLFHYRHNVIVDLNYSTHTKDNARVKFDIKTRLSTSILILLITRYQLLTYDPRRFFSFYFIFSIFFIFLSLCDSLVAFSSLPSSSPIPPTSAANPPATIAKTPGPPTISHPSGK
jgi:hypothetical protein